jgi:hypothetical protein
MMGLRNLIKLGKKRSTVDVQVSDIRVLGKNQQVLILRPYGIHSRAPADSIVLLLAPEAHEDSMIGVETDAQNQDVLAEAEFAVGIPTLTARLKFRDDDTMAFVIDSVEGGDFLARFNELKAGFDELKADHNDLVSKWNAFAGAYVPGSPTVQGTPPTASTDTASTASIDSSKIDELEVPPA